MTSTATPESLLGTARDLCADPPAALEGRWPRAVALLKAKNRLSADDAKLVEKSFADRMALQAAYDLEEAQIARYTG